MKINVRLNAAHEWRYEKFILIGKDGKIMTPCNKLKL